MRTILFLIRKEFLQIKRNKGILPILFVLPIIQLLVLSFAVDFEIKNLRIFWIDQDHSSVTRLFQQKLEASDYFIMAGSSSNPNAGNIILDEGKADLYVHIPSGFEEGLIRDGKGEIQLIADAIDGTKAGLGSYYLSQIVMDLNREVREQYGAKLGIAPPKVKSVKTTYSFWFNPNLNYKTFMVPGILVLLVTMIGAFVSAMNIVREKELGTIEQLNVTPIKKYQFIIGKLAPLWVIALIEFTLGLIVAKLIFNIPFVGSISLVYLFTAVYLIVVLGIGMLVSTLTETQQQAMFISWFFLVIFILMSGLFTPIENMPEWAQKITLFNPVSYFIEVIRMVMLKGAQFRDISTQLLIIAMYGFAINGLAVWRYRKTV